MKTIVKNMRFFSFSETKAVAPSIPVPVMKETMSGKDKYRFYYKKGPELFLTKVLMINGPLTNK